MKQTNSFKLKTKSALLAGVAATLAMSATSHAQSSDALIDKLVDKGILSVSEAKDLRDEADKDFKSAFAAKSGMPDYVTGYKISGDVRGRFEGFYVDQPNVVDRNRLRYRLRAGLTISMLENFEAGFRLTSSDAASGGANNEGDPLSGNTTAQNNGSKKLVYIDQAYGKWTPFTGPGLTGGFTVGKMENPFVFSDLVMDPDYTPEGLAAQFAYQINDAHSLKLNAAGIMLDEISTSEKDPWLLGIQGRWDATWSAKFSTTAGAAWLPMISRKSLTTGSVPNQQRGNARDGSGALVYGFDPFVIDASATYLFDSAPFYTGAFPVKVGGEYVINPGAPSGADNYAFSGGIVIGKSGKKKTWEASYTYKWLGANSIWEEFSDSDFGAYYAAANSPANSGSGVGYGSGPNTKGHVFKFAYSPSDSVTVSFKWFLTDLITPYPASANSGMSRMQVDAMWKF